MARVTREIEFDTEQDADLLALLTAIPEPHFSRVMVLLLGLAFRKEALDKIIDVLGGWPVEPGTTATAAQLDAIKAILQDVGGWHEGA